MNVTMENDNLNPQGKKGLTSKQIVDNFNSNIPKDNLRLIVFFALGFLLILVSYLVYFKFNSSNSNSFQAINKGKLTKPTVQDSIKIISPRKIVIKSKNLLALKDDVRLKSEQEFKNYSLIMESVKLDVNNSTLSFDVKTGKSIYFALTVLWGPLANGGCVSCKNALFKNPGSKSILGLNDSMYEYQVIALATH